MPVAYIRGWIEWYGMTLEVTPDVLIPRPDSEVLLEEALRIGRERGARVVADIGTGSGALAIALATSLPEAQVVATDKSSAALSVARRNAARHGLEDRVELLEGDLLEPVTGCPDLLVANLPYLSDEMMNEIDADVRHEPETALRGGPTGLELYGRLLDQLSGREWAPPLVLEIDPRQASLTGPLVHRDFPRADVRLVPDLAGRSRVLVVLPAGGRDGR